MRVVIALGGNALLRRGEPMDAAVQRANVKVAAEAIAAVAEDHQVVLTHGNGPQVGLLALQNAAYEPVAPYPLDVLDAETEGMVGYLLEQELGNHLDRERLATLLTQIIVDPDDPAFTHPTQVRRAHLRRRRRVPAHRHPRMGHGSRRRRVPPAWSPRPSPWRSSSSPPSASSSRGG